MNDYYVVFDELNNKEQNITQLSPEEQEKQAYVKVLEFITNTFYKTDENDIISVELSKGPSKGENFYDTKRIVLSEGLVDAFGELNLPRFLIYYHELGHHLYSHGLFELQKKWQAITQGPLAWNKKYEHLLNWIEDFYIENKLIQEHSYLTDVLTCIKKLPPEYDINKIEYAFNYWYINQAPTPALSYVDQIAFKAYITKLLNLRGTKIVRFGKGIVTNLSIKTSVETKFALLIIEFYNWCVTKGIFPDDSALPPLQNPNNHLEIEQGSNDQSSSNQETHQQEQNDQDQGNQQSDQDQGDQQNNNSSGTSSDHSGQVGKTDEYTEVTHIKSPTTVFKEELATENKLIQKELLDMSQRIQTDITTIDGLFTTTYKDSCIIQPKVNVLNFFNPKRLIDQVLFKEKQHTYMNVAIYRDISGSTSGQIHRLMHYVCEQLYKDISVDITYYLYSSGPISIVEVPYVPWEDTYAMPLIYQQNPVVQQLRGGTNSDAIADVITQQLSDKWLNIIITDGDLDALMRRDNITALLKNVFVIAVHGNVPNGLLGIKIETLSDLNKINPVLSTININN